MNAIRQFIENDMQSPSSLVRNYAAILYRETARRASARGGETWAKAVMFRFTGKKTLKESVVAWKNEALLDDVESAFMEHILDRSDALESSPSWQNVILSETTEEQMEALRKFLSSCLESFRMENLDKWRNTKGTFSYYYRKSQNALRKNLPNADWQLYEPKSWFYGPCGLQDPVMLNENNPEILSTIPLPSVGRVGAGKLFYSKPVVLYAKWFYKSLKDKKSSENTIIIAIKNFTWWLCNKHDLLKHDEIILDPNDNCFSYDDYTEEFAIQLDIDKLAKMAMEQLSILERKIILLKLQDMTHDEVARELGLSSPSHVTYYLKKIGKVITRVKMECPAMCGAEDEDGLSYTMQENDGFLDSKLKMAFTEFFVKFCRKHMQ